MNQSTRYKIAIPLVLLTVLGASVASARHAHRARHPYIPPAKEMSAIPPAAPASRAPVEVWVNTKTGVYHYPGERWYGRTKNGQMMGEDAARRAGYRPTGNGQ